MSNWVRAAAVDDVRDGGAKSFAYLDKRIALFRTPGGIFASDNRCPHQGYALVRGDVKDGVLTCMRRSLRIAGRAAGAAF